MMRILPASSSTASLQVRADRKKVLRCALRVGDGEKVVTKTQKSSQPRKTAALSGGENSSKPSQQRTRPQKKGRASRDHSRVRSLRQLLRELDVDFVSYQTFFQPDREHPPDRIRRILADRFVTTATSPFFAGTRIHRSQGRIQGRE